MLPWRAREESDPKILPQHLSLDASFRARFDREAKAIGSLQHPHIYTLHDIGWQDGLGYLVMEFIKGETLSARMERNCSG